MDSLQKIQYSTARLCREEALRESAVALLHGDTTTAIIKARQAMRHEDHMMKVVNEAHCIDCGAHEREKCSPTCGFDGPTPSDAMADATEASRD